MPSASDPRQPNRTQQPASRPAQPSQRPAQPTQRAAQPAARPAQSFSRSAQPVQRTGRQPSARSVQHSASHAVQQPTARTAQQAAPALSSRHLPSERRPPNRIRITLVVRMALLRRPARATTRMLVAVLKRKAPRCL